MAAAIASATGTHAAATDAQRAVRGGATGKVGT